MRRRPLGVNQIETYQQGIPRPVQIVETGEVFPSIKACARHIGGASAGICNVLSGRRLTHMEYSFLVLTPEEYDKYRKDLR